MKSFLAILSTLSFLAVFPFGAWAVLSADRVFEHLQDHHAEVWTSLGKPRLRIGVDKTVAHPPALYFFKARYLLTPDPALHALGARTRKALLLSCGALIVFTVSIVASTLGSALGAF